MTQHVIFVCKSCGFSSTQPEYMGDRGGQHLLQQINELSQAWESRSAYRIEVTTCLSACNRCCVIALAAPHKTTLMFGDLPPLDSAADILQLATQYHASHDGLIPRQERPERLKKGILARIPPLPGSLIIQ
jgi:predicted metal-binding protein